MQQITCQCRRRGFDPWVRKTPGSREWQPAPEIPWRKLQKLPKKSHGQKKPGGAISPWTCKESAMTEQLSTQAHQVNNVFSLASKVS